MKMKASAEVSLDNTGFGASHLLLFYPNDRALFQKAIQLCKAPI